MKKYSATFVFLAFLLIVALLMAVLPAKEYSENEKRVLGQFPAFSLESVTDGSFGSQLETYLADQFPLRDLFVGIHAYGQLLLGQNGASGVYAAEDGFLIAAPKEIDPQRVERNVRQLEAFRDSTGLPGAIMVVPSAGYMLEDKLPNVHESYQDDAIMEIVQKTAGEMQVIDLRQVLSEDPEDAYYRTDHHLTSSGSYRMYRAFCEKLGLAPEIFARKEIYGGFYGTAYSTSGLWATEPDTVEIWEPESPGQYQVTIVEGTQSETFDSLYFTEHLENMDKYPVFLDGNHSLVSVENKACQNGRRLMILKDSYAHCFATFAIENYEQILLLDMRYFRGSAQEVAQQYGITELLFLYGSENLATSTDFGWLLPLA